MGYYAKVGRTGACVSYLEAERAPGPPRIIRGEVRGDSLLFNSLLKARIPMTPINSLRSYQRVRFAA